MTTKTIIANSNGCFLEVTHCDSKPESWIVNQSVRRLWFKRRLSSIAFIDGHQAFAFANELKRKFENFLGSARREDMS